MRTKNETAKAYYIEKVYRESKESNTFKEINQMGLELMGKIDDYALAETCFWLSNLYKLVLMAPIIFWN